MELRTKQKISISFHLTYINLPSYGSYTLHGTGTGTGTGTGMVTIEKQ